MHIFACKQHTVFLVNDFTERINYSLLRSVQIFIYVPNAQELIYNQYTIFRTIQQKTKNCP